MNQLGRQWAGRVYGTNTGNLFIDFQESGERLRGTLRFLDNLFGLAIYDVEGTYSDGFKLKGKPIQAHENVAVGELEVEGILNSQGHLQGSWKSTLGTAGTFVAFPHDIVPPQSKSSETPMIPEQMHNKNIRLGALRLFQNDIVHLLGCAKQDFVSGRMVVTYDSNGGEVTKYEDDFLKDASGIGTLKYLKATIQEHEAYGINRVVVIELRAFGENEVRVQGVQESWVIGKAEMIAAFLRERQNALVTKYKKFGLSLNQFVFLGMLVAMPSILSWQKRTIFGATVFALLTLLLWLHARFIPNASIKMTEAQPTWFARMWPSLASWAGTVLSALAASWLFYLLTKTPTP